MDITKSALRSFFSKKSQAILTVLLVILGVFIFTLFTEQNEVMNKSITEYDAFQNVEDYSFIPRLNLTESQWDNIFEVYNVPESVQADFENNRINADGIIQLYGVNIYDYQQEFIGGLETQYDLTIETSFNKMVTNMVNGHEYRVFSDSGSIDKPYIVEGALPTAENELTVLPEYAKYNNLEIGDTLDINGVVYTITGFVYHPANIYPVVSSNVVKESSVYYPEAHSVIFMTEDSLNRLEGQASYSYKSRNNSAMTDGEKNVIYYELYDTNYFEVIDSGLKTISHGEVYIRAESVSTISTIFVIVFSVICMFVISQIVKRRVEADKRQIGTLKALGYKTWEIARSYCASAVIIALVGSVVGYVLGHLSYGLLIDIAYKDYNLPILTNATTYTTMIYALTVPLILLATVSLITALLNLRQRPRELMDENKGSSVNALGRFAARSLKKASFVIRTKYQIACRSVSKLVAMLSIGFCASVVVIVGLVLSTAFGGIMDKTFSGLDAENLVTYKAIRNVNDTPTQYEDEEIVMAKDLFIQEVIYQDGSKTVFDATNKIQTETAGIDSDNTYAQLTNANGEIINEAVNNGVIVNRVLQGKYSLSIGDRLLLQNTHEGIEVEVVVSEIADQYSGYVMYTDREYLNSVFGYEEGSYNSVYTNHKYPLSDPEIDKILSITEFKEGLSNNISTFQIVFQLITILAVILALVLMFISANLVIEENAKSISTFKVLGYSSSEISNLVVNTYTPLMVIGYGLAIPVSIYLMNFLKMTLETKFDMPITSSLGIGYALLGFAILMITYYVGLRFSRRNIDKIVLAESLKYEG